MTKFKSIVNGIFVWLMLGVFPLMVSEGGYTNITMTKYTFWAGVVGVFAILKLIIAVKEKSFNAFRSFTFWAVVVFFLVACVSAYFSHFNTDITFGIGRNEGLPTLALYVLTFLCGMGIKFKRSYIIPLALSSLGFSAVALMQFLDMNPLGLYPSTYYYYAAQDIYTSRFVGTIGNEGIASAFMAVAIMLFFAYFVTSKKKRSVFVLIPMTLLFFIQLYCEVLGGIIGTLGGLFIAGFMLLTSHRRLSRMFLCGGVFVFCFALKHFIVPEYSYPDLTINLRHDIVFVFILLAALAMFIFAVIAWAIPLRTNYERLRGVLALICALAVIFGMFYVTESDATEGIIFEAKEILNGRIDDSFGSSRVMIWRESLELWREQPLLGSGPNTFAQRSEIIFERYSPLKGEVIRTSVDNAHNELINLLVNLGILGLLPFLAAVFSVLFKARKNTAQKVCCSGLWGYFLQSLFLFSICITAPYYWMLLGMASSDM